MIEKKDAAITTTIAKSVFLSLIFSLLVFSPFAFAAIAVDGSLSDWGVNPGPYNPVSPQAQWIPSTTGVDYISNQHNPSVDYLGPGWGGGQFDVQAIYYTKQSNTAYFAVVTGFPITGVVEGGAPYFPGDLAIDFGSNGSYEFGVATTTHSGINKGDLVGNATWQAPYFTVSGPYALAGGTDLGAVQFAYGTSYAANGYYVYEFGIPIALFGSYWTGVNPEFTVHWTMSCGNDALSLNVPDPAVPEPRTYLLLIMGLVAFLVYRRFAGSKRV